MITSGLSHCVCTLTKTTVQGGISDAHQSSSKLAQAQLPGLQDKLSQVTVPEEPASSSHPPSELHTLRGLAFIQGCSQKFS